MSRFVLRSKEGTKLPEQKEKEKQKSPLNALKTTPSKRIDSRKSRNSISSKDTVQPFSLLPCPKQITANGDEEDDKSAKISIICSLPLSRLTGIIEKLNIKTPSQCLNNRNSIENVFTKPPGKTSTNGTNSVDDEDNIKCKDQDEKQTFSSDTLDDTSNSKSQDQLLVKILCLYCDKKFSTHKMQLKHIEKCHTPQKDRRCSVRNSQVQLQQTTSPRRSKSSSSKHSLSSTNFPGCTYCKKTKTLETAADSAAIDFNGLFLHLTEYHADKYFGCKACMMRFQNIAKLLNHMQNVHNSLPDAQLKLTKEYNDTVDELITEPTTPQSPPTPETHTRTKQRQHIVTPDTTTTTSEISVLGESNVMGTEEAILSRLGLTQNRRRNPSNRKGVRLRRGDTSVQDVLLVKNDAMLPGTSSSSLLSSSSSSSSSSVVAATVSTSLVSLNASPSKSRSRATTATKSTNLNNVDTSDSVVFRVPARTVDTLSTAFDESFYKEVTSNVRNNLLFYLDGKLDDRSHKMEQEATEEYQDKSLPLLLRSTLASNLTTLTENMDSNNMQDAEIHVATNLPATTTAFPTLLTAKQYCVDVNSTKLRRPHTKNSWKWKWDSVKKYKLINEGGKIVKKAKHPLLGLRDLSKLDMWTQLSMRQKHEKQLSQNINTPDENCSIEKRRLNDQLNSLLDMRVLPHIILEQSEQAIIKFENDEFNFTSSIYERHDDDDFYTGQTFADEGFLSLLQLLRRRDTTMRQPERQLVLSGEWARPRCYLCMCCGNKFEKLKSLEEHKMFRHSNILSTHYEVVGRELLAGNILQHLFIPKRALSHYSSMISNSNAAMGNHQPRTQLVSYRRVLHTSGEEESSDSIQSISNCFNERRQRAFSSKPLNNSTTTTDECDTDTKTTLLGDINTISPSNSSFSSSIITPTSSSLNQNVKKENKKHSERTKWKCTKCNRKCNGMPDLYRHMLDCSGDYVWSMAKKRKYRYYCGSKKRRPLHKQQYSLESRKTKQEKATKSQTIEHSTTEESSSNSYKPKTPPRQRPSDAESIKKMLENLPPKRICKKIFPTVHKVKKARKPVFINKLFNTKVLRKTRARQISNAAKRAANSRFSGKQQQQSIKNNALKSLRCKANKKIKHPKSSSTTTVTPIESSPKSSLNLEAEKEEPKNKNSEESNNKTETNEGIEKQVDPSPEEIPIPESCNAKNVESIIEIPKETKKPNELKTDTICEEKKELDKNVSTPPTIEVVQKTTEISKTQKQNENQVCTKKRSKRISDCIAMLTGKLEEKLKTEVTEVNKPNDDKLGKKDTPKTSLSVEKEIEKKTPKRKTLSRRIIKPDVNDSTSTDIEQQINNSVIITTVPSIVTTITTATTSKRLTSAKTITKEAVKTAIATTTTAIKQTPQSPIVPITPSKLTKPIVTIPIPATPPSPVRAIPINAQPLPIANLSLPCGMAPPTFVTIPLPIPNTLQAVPILQNQLPVFLPVQQNLPATLQLTLPPNISPPTMMILPPTFDETHVSPAIPATENSNEPLNLSSVKGPKKQTTAELRAQRPGMPTRRQTICGFEARELISFNDMEPLDLSNKSKQNLPPPILKPPPSTVQVQQISAQSPLELSTNATPLDLPNPTTTTTTTTLIQVDDTSTKAVAHMGIAPAVILPTEAVFNKHFYSNLDLLKIPQVRASGFVPVNIPINETVNTLNNGINMSSNLNNVPNKTNNKKRNNTKGSAEQNLSKVTITASTSVGTPSKVKENTSTNKKEGTGKNKNISKMEQEVINHIDDAINSVINAVKDSLPDDDIQIVKPNEILFETKSDMMEKPFDNIISLLETTPVINKENSTTASPQIVLTPKKRTMRSKTLDCRPAQPVSRTDLFSPISSPINIVTSDQIITNDDESTVIKESINVENKAEDPIEIVSNKIIEEEQIVKPSNTIEALPVVIISNNEQKTLKKSNDNASNIESEKETKSPISTAIEEEKVTVEQVEPAALHESNVVNLLVEENMSNINNTSSGFHSSGTPDIVGVVKKKQRKRRKNELAAIVADQLLESFKIDKARRDSLKKLENLAYEKSEDLLLTGMLLMSSTKRNASCNINFSQNAAEKRSTENSKRQKQDVTTTTSQAPKTRAKSNENSMKNVTPKAKDIIIEDFNQVTTTRRSKRRQSRRKSTPLDNENLSKLKTSLESFSIGIEKQLSEIEARNTNVFNNSTESRTRKNNDSSTIKPIVSILRPSILSATLEQADTQKNTSTTTTTFSRDPRLNKNIHKDEQQASQMTLLSDEKKNMPTVCDMEDDNYLTEIAKNVNEKIMAEENEDEDGFEIGNDFQDDSNSRPPTSMSVRSAPNFDDHSNFDSICDENTNTEVMDMDLDDELSVYTSFSQDLGRGRGRKRRRRRSILLKRRPKKQRRSSQDLTAEKFECELCKKTFFAATSLSKHNMTLAHVSKVSEREYLQSKSGRSTPLQEDKRKSSGPAKPIARRQSFSENLLEKQWDQLLPIIPTENISMISDSNKDPIIINNIMDSSHRLSLNPDERLFFECCNILKSADTSRIVRADNDNEVPAMVQSQSHFVNMYKNPTSASIAAGRATAATIHESNLILLQKSLLDEKPAAKDGETAKTQDAFRNPNLISSCFNKMSSTAATSIANERQIPSPTYTQFSAITNTTSRFKTKAAMKGYENGNAQMMHATCKLTELADIALGHDDKPRTANRVTNSDQGITAAAAAAAAAKRIVTPEYVTLSVVDGRRNCNFNAIQENKKSTETQGSSSSRTIMHSSIIKAAVEEHIKPQPANKIIIPERPFKNIGLEEKESITFQKPKTTINLLLDDNSVSTASYSDRDDFDFGSMSCDDEVSDKTLNEKILKSNSSDSSSSRATAKTFENKSLIMGRIFKNASTKPKTPVKSVGIQKDHLPKADLDQLFDELRAEGIQKPKPIETIPIRKDVSTIVQEDILQFAKDPPQQMPKIVVEPKRKAKTAAKKPKENKKSKKDYTKLQSELGMSQEEIEKLIDDGQRKSKRRCATNRSKKLVEMWSSDEYEEFLSTKDIIALIEEKEKQEQRKKRKNVTHNISGAEMAIKERESMSGTTESAINSTRKYSRSHSNTEDKPAEKLKIAFKEKDTTPIQTLETSRMKASKCMKPPDEQHTTNKSKAKQKTKKAKNTRQTSNKGHKDVKVTERITVTPIEPPPLLSQVSEHNVFLHDIKTCKDQSPFQLHTQHTNNNNNNNNNATRNNKTKKNKSAKEDVNIFKAQNKETQKDMTVSKKRSNNNNNNNNNNKKNKGKKKPQTEKSPARKRQASEKLYYWSSSSDEEFGRINDNEPEYESSEPYQKHGWIVGDSHKKLVTLLAIAKGNKKVESCGVKKKVSKRKS